MAVPAPQSAPAWANELALAYESRASSQFILFGNVHDRLAVGEKLVSLADFLEDTLLKRFGVVLSYDMGTGLIIERGGEIVAKWQGAELQQQMREPLQAVKWIDRYLRYLGNLRALGNSEKTPNVAVIVRNVDHIVPADGAGFEHGSITSMLRAWSCDSPFADLPFTSLLIADNLNDVEPLIASSAQTVRTRVPLPDAAALEQALGILRKQSPRAFAADANLPQIAGMLAGVTVSSLESLTRIRHHENKPLADADLAKLKKELVERDSAGLVEFIEGKRTLERLPRAGSAQDLAAPGHRAVARRGPQGPAHGLSTLRPGGHGQDLPGRVPGRRSRRAGGQAQEFPRSLGGILRRQSREDIPAHPRARALHGVHRRGRPDAGQAGLGRERLGPLRPHLLDDRAGDVGQRQSRARVVVVSLLAAGSHRGGPEASRPHRREGAAAAHQHPRRERAARRHAGEALRARNQRRGPRRASSRACPRCLRPARPKHWWSRRTAMRARRTCLAARRSKPASTGYQNPVPADVLEFQMRIAIREATDLGFVPPAFRAMASTSS